MDNVVFSKSLLRKLEGVGVVDKVLAWDREWLTERRQKVVLMLHGNESGLGAVKSGIVLGSLLGLVILLIFIKEVVARVWKSHRTR